MNKGLNLGLIYALPLAKRAAKGADPTEGSNGPGAAYGVDLPDAQDPLLQKMIEEGNSKFPAQRLLRSYGSPKHESEQASQRW